jgi:hypothetical protein
VDPVFRDSRRVLEDDGNTDLQFYQGIISVWNTATFANVIQVAGTTLRNIPVLTSAGLNALRAGDPIALLKYKNSWFIIGRVVGITSSFVEAQFPIVLYPMFQSAVALGSGGFSLLNAGTLTTWEGRVRVSHPKIEVDGIWGQASGSNTVRYDLLIGGKSVGYWIVTGVVEVARHGPFDVSAFIGQDWLKIELAITSSTGTGQVAFQPLGVYFRQT